MGILGSFNIGVTGITSVGEGMSVIADNIANAGTFGFKSSRPEFQDVLANSLKGIDGGDQIGSGVKLAHTKPLITQGGLVRTSQVTDLAINGNGFFVVDAPFGKGYTRDGGFHFDKDGFLINSDGYNVLGYVGNSDGKITNKVDSIKLPGITIPAVGTETVNVQMNLDSRAKIQQFDPEFPDETSSYNTGIVVYDNVGTARLVTVYFNRTDFNNWEYHAMVQGEDATGGEKGTFVEMASGSLNFTEKGTLNEEQEGSNSFNFNKGAKQDQKIVFNFGESILEGGDGFDASTMYGSETSVSRHTQDGSSAGSLSTLSFNDKGILTAVYNNGEDRDLGQVVISKFQNSEGLFKMGKNLFRETRKSGQGTLGRPNEGGRGEVLSKSIEHSNVDIAQEFVNLMTSQRNFTANTRTITTADQMLQDILNIKR